MIESKKISIIAAAAMVVAIAIVLVMMLLPDGKLKEALTAEAEPIYANQLFGTEIMTIDIIADETAWQNMLDNAMSEEYISVDVVINNKKISNVGIRPKGNNSLQQVSSSDSNRYSFKIKFDEYVDGQTCYGLDMLVLNNMIGDAACMKEYTAFDMMKSLGIETPYFNYADISLNGEKWGLYFAIEAYNDSYKQRVSGDESGVLYNVKTVGGMGGNDNGMMNSESSSENKQPAADNPEKQGFDRNGKDRMSGGMGAGSSGGALLYTDGNSSSYPAIFRNAVGNNSTEEDYQRVITAIKALNESENIEEYFDVDEILRYLAVHTAVVNLDSYSSEMAQNYYIYEYGGKLQILPWDYNYAWGAFMGGNASDTINFPIDTPVCGVEMSERPLISKLLENEEYLAKYHSYLEQLMDNYFADGNFSAKLDKINDVIDNYVKNDPTAFYTYDEYLKAIDTFKKIAELRMTSIKGQLDGAIPATTEEQKASPDKLVDTAGVNLSDLGTGISGGDFGGFGNQHRNNRPDGNFPNKDPMPQTNNILPQMPHGEMPETPDSFNTVPPQLQEIPNGKQSSPSENNPAPDEKNNAENLSAALISLAALVIAIFGVSFVKNKF